MPQTLTKTQTIQSLLTQYSGQIQAALPRHLTPERMARLALTTVRRNRTLGQADPVSLFGAIIECSQLGLEPGRGAHLVPFRNKKRGTIEVQMIPDYRGLMDLARRSGGVGEFYAQEVRAGDEFDYQYGTDKYLRHKPVANRGEIIAFYAFASAPDHAWNQFEVMSKAEVDEIRARSKASEDGPWVTDYPTMGRKTVIKRLCKVLPSSPELSQAIGMDDQHAAGISQANRAVIDADFMAEEDEAEEAPAAIRMPQAKAAVAQAEARVQQEAPPFTPEQIAEQITRAKTDDALAEATDLIGSIPDPAERAHLVAAAKDAHARVAAAHDAPAAAGLSAGQAKILRDKLKGAGKTPDQFAQHFGCDLDQLQAERFKEAVTWCKGEGPGRA